MSQTKYTAIPAPNLRNNATGYALYYGHRVLWEMLDPAKGQTLEELLKRLQEKIAPSHTPLMLIHHAWEYINKEVDPQQVLWAFVHNGLATMASEITIRTLEEAGEWFDAVELSERERELKKVLPNASLERWWCDLEEDEQQAAFAAITGQTKQYEQTP